MTTTSKTNSPCVVDSSNATAATADRMRIRLDPELHEIGDAAVAAVARIPGIYVRGGCLTRIVAPDPGACAHRGSFRIEPVPATSLLEGLTRVAEFYEARPLGGIEAFEKRVVPPERVARQVMDRPAWPGVPVLNALVDHPVVLASGDIVSAPGFHADAGIFVAGALPIGEVQIGRDAARDAADALVDLVCDFPFESAAGRSAWLATLLTVFARMAIPGPCPMLLIDANTRGAGKTRLADLIGTIATGRGVPRQVMPERDAEMRKRITTLAMAGTPIAFFDNVRGRLGTPSLEAALTADVWQDRMLGGNRMVEMPLSLTWMASGNNVDITPDILRRVLYSRLVAQQEHPEARSGFKHPRLLETARRNRAALVRHALTIVASYIRAGRPSQGLPAWGGFEEWSDLVRGAIRWVGMADPYEARHVLAAADVETEALRMLMVGWPRREGAPQILSASDLLTRWRDPVGEALAALGAKDSAVSIGRVLSRHQQRIVGDSCLHRQRNSRGSWDWTVRRPDALPGQRAPSDDAGDSGDAGDPCTHVVTNPVHDRHEVRG